MWHYEYTLKSEYARILNLAVIRKVLNTRESEITELKITAQAK